MSAAEPHTTPESLLLEYAFYSSLQEITENVADAAHNLQCNNDNKPIDFQEEDWPDTAITNSGEEVYIAGEVTALTGGQEIKEHELNSILSNAQEYAHDQNIDIEDINAYFAVNCSPRMEATHASQSAWGLIFKSHDRSDRPNIVPIDLRQHEDFLGALQNFEVHPVEALDQVLGGLSKVARLHDQNRDLGENTSDWLGIARGVYEQINEGAVDRLDELTVTIRTRVEGHETIEWPLVLNEQSIQEKLETLREHNDRMGLQDAVTLPEDAGGEELLKALQKQAIEVYQTASKALTGGAQIEENIKKHRKLPHVFAKLDDLNERWRQKAEDMAEDINICSSKLSMGLSFDPDKQGLIEFRKITKQVKHRLIQDKIIDWKKEEQLDEIMQEQGISEFVKKLKNIVEEDCRCDRTKEKEGRQ